MMQLMRIAMIHTPLTGRGGGERQILRLAIELQKLGHEVEILMNNFKLRKKLGENAYEYVKRNLSWEKYAENMESVFQQTISNFGRSP